MYNYQPEGDKNTTKMSEIKLQVGKTYQLIKDWFHSKTGVSLMHDPSLISLVNEIEALGLSHVSNSALQENTKLIDNMCISYRHDFGLMDKEQQDKLRFECKEWLRAYENNREHCC